MAQRDADGPKRFRVFDGAFWFLLTVAVISGAVAFWRVGADALPQAGSQLVSDAAFILPQIVLGVTVGALFTALVPREVVSRLLGSQAGIRGILLATVCGAAMPAGPFASFPLVYALGRAGAGIGSLIAFLVAWAAIGLNRLVIWELPFMGAEFATLRFLSSLPLPIIAGLLAERLTRSIPFLRVDR